MTVNAEVAAGDRFAFGENWSQFLSTINEDSIEQASRSLRGMLGVERLDGRRFLDIGSGSGLSSLAARRMGATVYSFDYDEKSVACTAELRRRYFPNDASWVVASGSILDDGFVAELGRWDIVYSWGVLHHTGAMWKALENAASLVTPDGLVFIAIYNDEGYISERWKRIKKAYNAHRWMRPLLLAYGWIHAWGANFLSDLVHLRPFRSWRGYGRERGMSPWRDVVDWVGGWPFEVAAPHVIFRFFRDRGFSLEALITRAGYGCNEFVFREGRRVNVPNVAEGRGPT